MSGALTAGFADAVVSGQAVFRAVMDAMARPGTIHAIGDVVEAPAPLSASLAAIALTLFDQDTPVWLDVPLAASPAVSEWIRFHTGAPIVTNGLVAAFAIVSAPEQAPPFETFQLGTADYPDRSTTIIFDVETLSGGAPLRLTGPGIKGDAVLRPRPLPADIGRRLLANRALFPRGIDLVLAAPGAVAALPRTVMLGD